LSPYRAAIVGLSWIGADPPAAATDPILGTAPPFSHAAAYAAHPGVEVVAACDLDPEARAAFRRAWDATWPGLRTYDDHRRLLAEERLDLLSVVTPDDRHAQIVLDACAAGVRGIFCEKPLATTLAEADAIVQAARERGVTMAVNFTRRWQAPYVAARRLLREGRIGAVAQVTIHFGGPRAMLFRNHSHFFDLLAFLADSEPEWVIAELESGFAGYGVAYRGDGGHDPATEPGLNAYVAFRNGVRGYLAGMKRGFQEVTVRVSGEGGRLDIGDDALTLTTRRDAALVQEAIHPRATRTGMQAAVSDLIAALETGRPTQSPPEQARATVAVTLAALASQARGNVPVRLDKPRAAQPLTAGTGRR